MKWYSSEIADMKVSVFCNGLDNLLSKTGYEFTENDDYEDADVLLIFSAKCDKAVLKVLDKIEEKGNFGFCPCNSSLFCYGSTYKSFHNASPLYA